MSKKEKVSSLITHLYETMNGELALDYANLDSENIEILLDYIERLNNIINEQDKELELERKSRQLLTDDLANICEMSLKKENIIKEVREYIASFNLLKDLGALEKEPISISELKHILELLNIGEDDEEN